ncbi:MAG: enoyl-CoA hydratase/isomerase family protein [Deltaproteobacteria bacterium]|nr:MAG: enoyl-CoA hydratase/isomerase family protein [Deltaproteobacteria bacterium]
MTENVIVEQKEGVALVSLNRPKAYNAFDLPTIRRLAEVLLALSLDSTVSGVVITGKGKAFCAGGDLRWIASYKDDYGAAFYELAATYHQAILEIRRMPKPVIAAINGLAAGGGFSMALACDFRVMASSAVLKQAYTSNGLSIDGGGTFSLPRIVGPAKAMEIAAFDPVIRADQALEWGLVTEVVEEGESVKRSMEMVQKIAKGSLSSFWASKKLMTDSFNTSFEVQLEQERKWLSRCADHPNGREGITAFLEKREPKFV